jgi:predicted GTPase
MPDVTRYDPESAVILVGTKSDVWDPSAAGAITHAQIDATARQIKAVKAIVCSVKKNENIGDVFDLAIAAVIRDKDAFTAQ